MRTIALLFISVLIVSLSACAVREPKPMVEVIPSGDGYEVRSTELARKVLVDNCEGSGVQTQTFTDTLSLGQTLTLEQSLKVDASGSVNILGIGEVQVGAEIATKHGVQFTEIRSRERSREVQVAPGRKELFTVTRYEQVEKGRLAVQAGHVRREISYEIVTDFWLEATPETQECPDVPVIEKPLPTPSEPPSIEQFNASAMTIFRGETTTLEWRVVGESTVTLEPGVGEVKLADSTDVAPLQTTTYTLVATNNKGSDTQSLEILVRDKSERSLLYITDEGDIVYDLLARKASTIHSGSDRPSEEDLHLELGYTLDDGRTLDGQALKQILDAERSKITGFISVDVTGPFSVKLIYSHKDERLLLHELAKITIHVQE